MFAQLILFFVLTYAVSTAWAWRQNFTNLKRSGLNVVVSPIYIGDPIWMVLSKLVIPVINYLPRKWTRTWIDIISPSWVYHSTTTPFVRQGDIIMVASPGGMYMTTNNAELMSQLCTRRSDFIKPAKAYKLVEVFGQNVLSTEGSTWRTHRKATAPAFTEELHGLVWTETLRLVDQMLEIWHGRGSNSPEEMFVADLGRETIDLTLHIICKTGFGLTLSWPGEKHQIGVSDELEAFSTDEIPANHDMNFRVALESSLTNFLWFAVFSPRILGTLPFQAPRRAWLAWANFDLYLKELLESKRSKNLSARKNDLMARLVDASSIGDARTTTTNGMQISRPLQDSDIIGNAFVFMVAGHETTGISLQYACLLLAINRVAQRRLQADIDDILKEQDIQQCPYEKYYDRLSNSMVGAVINEQLRLMPPVILIPKVVATGDQTVVVDGRNVVVPNGTFIHLPSIALHRNPRYWPHQSSKRTGKSHDLDDFRPERWFVGEQNGHKQVFENGKTKIDTTQANKMYTPPHGSFIPFSEGQRGCLGRRFALVELTAALTSIFRHYTVELATDEWATKESMGQMTQQDRDKLYEEAIKTAWHKLETGASARLTLQLDKGNEIPVRFVRRGREKFAGNVHDDPGVS